MFSLCQISWMAFNLFLILSHHIQLILLNLSVTVFYFLGNFVVTYDEIVHMYRVSEPKDICILTIKDDLFTFFLITGNGYRNAMKK